MQTQHDWEKIVRKMELLMRLKSFPVGFKMLSDKKDLAKIPFMRRTSHKVTLCQLITLVRNFDWTVVAELNDFLFHTCASILGLTDMPAVHKDGTFRSIVWVKTKEDGKKFEAAIPRLPLGKYKAVALAPLVYNPFEPDIVLIYANPAQMMLLINSLQFEDYEVMQFFCVGESSCSDAIARCYHTNKPSLTIPCYGERRYGHAQDDDLVMALPAGVVVLLLAGSAILLAMPRAVAPARIPPPTVDESALAAIEQRDYPELRGKPVIVGGTGRRGVVSTASYEARVYGVRSAMPISEAQRRCPTGVFLPVRMSRYLEVSQEVMRILETYTPEFKQISIDEAFMDMSGTERLYGSPPDAGSRIKEQVRGQTGLTLSIGIAANRYLAKLASDLGKPDGFVVVEPDKAEAMLAELPVSAIRTGCATLPRPWPSASASSP